MTNEVKLGEWVSVKDRLPEEAKEYLTFDIYGDINIHSFLCLSAMFCVGERHLENEHIIFWMPLPPPPPKD